MPDYRRLISYIYEYEGKIKGKNVGFVKMDTRNGQCRLNVSVKRMYMGGNAIGVYLLGKDGQKTFLGNMFARNGTGEFRTNVDEENVEGSGMGLDAYYGLSVHDVKNSWRSYTTMWEDPLPNESWKEECVSEDEIEKIGMEEGNGDCIEDSEKNSSESCKKNRAEEKGTVELDIGNGPMAQDILRGSEADKPQKLELEAISQAIKEIESEIAEAERCEEEISKAEIEPDSPVMVSPELENPDVLRYLQETEQQEKDPEQRWQKIRRQYPKICPFDYDGECEVLTICPDDIGQLPRENWIYGNNSFLLHGYYNFRYLILVRLNDNGSVPRYLLGVPGHYYSNEKYMATMFGFPNFVLSKKQPSNDGRFGYWYTNIKMS